MLFNRNFPSLYHGACKFMFTSGQKEKIQSIVLKGELKEAFFQKRFCSKKKSRQLRQDVCINPYFFRLKSPRFQDLMNSDQAAGLKIFIGGTCPW